MVDHGRATSDKEPKHTPIKFLHQALVFSILLLTCWLHMVAFKRTENDEKTKEVSEEKHYLQYF